MSDKDAVVAFNLNNLLSDFCEIILATVVFPVPGGPYKIKFGRASSAIKFSIKLSFPKICS